MPYDLGIGGSARVVDLIVVKLNSPAFETLSIQLSGLLLVYVRRHS